ncbi:MAG: hypothetical protein JWN56_208 [Sphingobacteriales bacterium]|nr:hypothetical protein [Sphingobacteriales bacterium]
MTRKSFLPLRKKIGTKRPLERPNTYHIKLIQVLLPLFSLDGEAFPHNIYLKIREELAERFGGITTYTRSPVVGLWKEDQDKTVKDEIIIYEVMAADLDTEWWKTYKQSLERINLVLKI